MKRKDAEAQIEFYKNWEPTQEMYDEAANHKTGLKRFQLMWQLHHKISHLNGEMGILKVNSLYAKKMRFEINNFLLPNSLEGEFGIIRHPGAALAVPITKSGEVIILRQYRFDC